MSSFDQPTFTTVSGKSQNAYAAIKTGDVTVFGVVTHFEPADIASRLRAWIPNTGFGQALETIAAQVELIQASQKPGLNRLASPRNDVYSYRVTGVVTYEAVLNALRATGPRVQVILRGVDELNRDNAKMLLADYLMGTTFADYSGSPLFQQNHE